MPLILIEQIAGYPESMSQLVTSDVEQLVTHSTSLQVVNVITT